MAAAKGQLPPEGKRCAALTADGKQCRKHIWKEFDYCAVHQRSIDRAKREDLKNKVVEGVQLSAKTMFLINYLINSPDVDIRTPDEAIAWAFRYVSSSPGRGRWVMDQFGIQWRKFEAEQKHYGESIM